MYHGLKCFPGKEMAKEEEEASWEKKKMTGQMS